MIEWNKVIYADCMNEENGLPTLEDKNIDLCLTDPPYNINFKNKGKLTQRKTIIYDDNIKNYFNWCNNWLNELKRVCKGILFTCGTKHFYDWIINIKPDYQPHYWYKSNGCGHIIAEPIIGYGKIKNISSLRQVINLPVIPYDKILIHPCPKVYNFWFYLLNKLKPKSVIDPFMGSGTTAEVCTKLGIPWIGYEINEVYSQDINKRLRNCKKEPKQVTLMEVVNK